MTLPFVQSRSRQDGDLRSLFCWSHDRIFTGFVLDITNPSRRFVVELLVDGCAVKPVSATDYLAPLAAGAIGDGCYGFCFALDAQTLSNADKIEVRIANSTIRV